MKECMKPRFLSILCTMIIFTSLSSCSSEAEVKVDDGHEESSEILRLKRFDVFDKSGFGQPVLAVSFLAPTDWQFQGGIQWSPNSQCAFDLVSLHVSVTEPNGKRSFEIFPKYTSQWVDDPSTNQMMAAGQACRTAPPLSSVDFISQAFIPGFRQGASVVSSEPRPAAAQAHREKILAIEGPDLARYGASIHVDATQARIAYDFGSGKTEEWVLATSLISSMPFSGMGIPTQRHMTFIDNVLGFRAPAGELDSNKKLFGTITASFRVNPAYEDAVRNVIQTVIQIQVSGQMAQIRSIRQQSRRIFDDWNRSIDQRDAEWKNRMAYQDQVQRRFTEAIRGTQTLVDPHSPENSWEMTNDYEYVWKTANDEFILTNDINYNPNVSLNSDTWERMRSR